MTLDHVAVQALFYGADWKTNPSLFQQTAQFENYLKYMVNSPYMDMLTQAGYNVGRGSSTAGQTLNLAINKSTGISDAQIHADLQSAISSGQLAAPDANRLYVVFVEDNVAVSNNSYLDIAHYDNSIRDSLSYHGTFGGIDFAGRGRDIHYAVIAYPGGSIPLPGGPAANISLSWLSSLKPLRGCRASPVNCPAGSPPVAPLLAAAAR